MLRRMIHTFISLNKSIKLQDINIQEGIQPDAKSIEEYLENIVLKEREEARTIIIVITPLVLRISLEVILLDFYDEVFMIIILLEKMQYFII